jgi:hypothetical protein
VKRSTGCSALQRVDPLFAEGLPPVPAHRLPGEDDGCRDHVVSREVEKLISMGAHPFEIKEKAMDEGMYTLSQDVVRKIMEGKTSFHEARRVLR